VSDTSNLHAVGARIEALLDELRSSTEGRVWMRVEELVRLLTELYGAGIARTVELVEDSPDVLRRLARDDLVGNLLVLHDLHPDDFETRAAAAVEALAPSVGKGGAQLELTGFDPAAAALAVTVTSTGSGCGSTSETLRTSVHDALADALPDAELIEVVMESAPAPTPVRLGRKPAPAGMGPP